MFQLVKLFAAVNTDCKTNCGYIQYGTPDYDAVQAEDPWGDLYHPTFGNNGNCDAGRSHTYCDYSSHYMNDFKPF
jgi:hypothetical protein